MPENSFQHPADSVRGIADLMQREVSESLRGLSLAMERSATNAWELTQTFGEAARKRRVVNQEMVDGLGKIAEMLHQGASLIGKTAWSARTAADALREMADVLSQAVVASEKKEDPGSNRT